MARSRGSRPEQQRWPARSLRRRCSALLLASLCLALAQGQPVASLASGDPLCPCLKPEELGPEAASLPPGWGVGCKAHFLDGAAVKGGNNVGCTGSASDRDWCTSSWCFVSPETCQLPANYFLDLNVLYSFPTCGYLDTFTPEMASTELANMTLRVVYLTNSGGYMGSYCLGGECTGPAADFWTALLKRTRAQVTIADRFNATNWPDLNIPFAPGVMRQFRADPKTATSKSTFDACIYAAGMGFVDLCIGASTVNADKVKVSQIIPIYQNDVWLVTRTDIQKDGVSQRMARSWQPFSDGAKAAIVIFVAGAGVLMTIHERCTTPRCEVRTRYDVARLGVGLAHGLYDGWMAFWSGGRTSYDPPASVGGRLTAMGLAIFVLMTCAAYTANLASFLVLKGKSTAQYSSIEDVLGQQLKICAETSVKETLAIKTGVPRDQIVGVTTRGELLDRVDIGDCSVASMRLEDLTLLQSKGQRCEYQAQQLLFTVMQGSAVSPRAARSLQWFQQRLAAEGVWDSLVTRATPQAQCPPPPQQSNELDFLSLSGPMFAAFVLFGAGIIAKPIEFFVRWKVRDTPLAKVVELGKQEEEMMEDVSEEIETGNAELKAVRRELQSQRNKLLNIEACLQELSHGGRAAPVTPRGHLQATPTLPGGVL